MTMRFSRASLLALLWMLATASFVVAESPHLRQTTTTTSSSSTRKLQTRQYYLLPLEDIHSTLLDWKLRYPNLVRVTTAQEAYGLPTAGTSSDCPFDTEVDGCLNYILTIQDYIVHPEESDSSNRLPEVFWSGELHGNERVGPTATMEAASLLLRAASCEAALDYDPSLHTSCSATLQQQEGITHRQRQWLARLVTTRRIIIVPTANALGYYQNVRTENGIDVNRDFPFDYTDPTQCMQTIGGRTLNEVFRSHLIQMALTFHAGYEIIGYEWGADTYNGFLSPDDEGQEQLAIALSHYGGEWSGTPLYPTGPMDRTVYTVKGGMEDWAYAASWDPPRVVQCQPTQYGGYDASKTTYNESVLRAFNLLVETSNDKIPTDGELGTSLNVLDRDTSGNGHVSRNIRLSLMSADIVEPYLQITGIDNLALSSSDLLPLTGRNCKRVNAVRVPSTLTSVTIEWTVGGALEIDETFLYFGNWNSVDGVDCYSQPPSSVESTMAMGTMLTSTTGTGYFSKFGVSPLSASAGGDAPLGPIFRASIDLSSFAMGDEVMVLVKAKVDQSWTLQPDGILPQTPPQSHIVNARTDSTWFHQNNGKIIQGHDEWYSVIPLTLVISNSAELEDISNSFEVTTPAPSTTAGETMSSPSAAPSTNAPVLSTTSSPVSTSTTTPPSATTTVPSATTPAPVTTSTTSPSPILSTQSPPSSPSTQTTPAPQGTTLMTTSVPQDTTTTTSTPSSSPTINLSLPTTSDIRDDDTSGATFACFSLGALSVASWIVFICM